MTRSVGILRVLARSGRLRLAGAALLAACMATVGTSAGTAGALTPAEIEGSGSSWAANALNQWVADVYSQGVDVVYSPDGDAQGRQDFANRVSDFAVTADGYQGQTSVTGIDDTSQGRPYAYLPIAAGGTSFPYQIKVDGHQVENLRLSGETLAKIFTNQITNWSNPEITADNNGHALPTLPIIPVVQSEGSGSTEQLTNYFATEDPSNWQAFAGESGPTEYFPRQGSQIAQDGSNAAMNYIASSEANGAIGYVEYSYALSVNYPVVKMLNSGGYYTLPTQYNVAIALEKAIINMDPTSPDYLLQTLKNVYTDSDPRTYPLSSYVYMIEPTGKYPKPETKITPGKRQAIADFEFYSICQGQKEIGPIGYSPLPVNLVEAGFGQIQKLQAASPTITLTTMNINDCDEPTFVPGNPTLNYLTTIAPMPPTCDQQGAGPCAAGVTPNGTGPTPTSSGTSSGSTTTTTPASTSQGTSPGGSASTQTTSPRKPAQAAGPPSAASATTTTMAPTPCNATSTSSTTSTSPAASSTMTTAAPTTASTTTASTTTTPPCIGTDTQAQGSGNGTGAPGTIDFVGTNLPAGGIWSHFGTVTLVVVAGLAVLFGAPSVIGYRRARRRQEAAR